MKYINNNVEKFTVPEADTGGPFGLDELCSRKSLTLSPEIILRPHRYSLHICTATIHIVGGVAQW